MAKKLNAAQRRYIENALLIAALGLTFKKLEEDYETKPLGDIADTTSGGTPLRNTSTYYGGNIPWIKSGELNDNLIEEAEEHITEEGLANSSAKIYPKGSLVVALYGATVGKTGILGLDAASNQAVCAIFPKTKEITIEFVFWFLRHKRPEFLGMSFGGAQPNISQKIIRETLIPIPPLALQEKLSDFFTVIEKRQNGDTSKTYLTLPNEFSDVIRKVTLIESLAARVNEAQRLREEADIEAEVLFASYLKTTRHQLLESDFPKSKIGDIAQVTSGGTPARDNPTYWGGDIPWIKTGELIDGDIFDSEEKITELGVKNSSARLFPPETVLVALYGQGQTRGRTARLMIEATTNQACCAILPTPDILDSRYTQYWQRSLYYEMREKSHGGAQPNWNGGMIKNIQIALPSLDEQRRIVVYLDGLQAKVNALRELQSASGEELSALMPSVLDRAFKGEL